MKKLLSVILAVLLAFSCLTVSAAPLSDDRQSVPDSDGLALSAEELVLPMFSVYSGERLRAYYDGVQVPANYFNWVSSDTGVVTVDQQGFLTAVAPGAATITVSDDDGESAECTVTVVEDDDFTRIGDLEYNDLTVLPFYSEEVGIGPLGGAEPVILKRFINPPSCSCDDPPDPNDLIPDEGWLYTYGVLFRVHAVYGQSIRFETSASQSDGQHATGAYVTLYDANFYIWEFNKGTNANPFGSVTLNSYEDGYFYIGITPISHTTDGGSGDICLYVYDVTDPYVPDDGLDLSPERITIPVFSNESGERLRAYVEGEYTPASNFTWTSSDTSVVTVDEDGYIWAAAPGTATVTATSADGSSGTSEITVVPDSEFTTVDQLDFTDIDIPYLDTQVGIGPLYGATPVILRREIPSPVCPAGRYYEGEYDADNGWAYTYAVGYHINVPAGHTINFITSAYEGEQANDVNTFITIYDSNFEVTGFRFNYGSDPYAKLTYDFYQGGDFYVVITPLNYNVIPGNGYIQFSITDSSSAVTLLGDVDCSGELDFADVSALYMFIIGMYVPGTSGEANADFDRNGSVNFSDIALLYGHLLYS